MVQSCGNCSRIRNKFLRRDSRERHASVLNLWLKHKRMCECRWSIRMGKVEREKVVAKNYGHWVSGPVLYTFPLFVFLEFPISNSGFFLFLVFWSSAISAAGKNGEKLNAWPLKWHLHEDLADACTRWRNEKNNRRNAIAWQLIPVFSRLAKTIGRTHSPIRCVSFICLALQP